MSGKISPLLKRLSEIAGAAPVSWPAISEYAGAEVDRLLRQRILIENAPAIQWDVCSDCSCGLAARPIEVVNGAPRASCPLDPASDAVLDEDDLRSFTVDFDRLVAVLADLAPVSGANRLITEGLWYLGRTDAQAHASITFKSGILRQNGIVPLMRQSAQGQPIILISPEFPEEAASLLLAADIRMVLLSDLLDDLETDEPCILAGHRRDGPELVIYHDSGKVEWRGRSIVFTHQTFPAFLRMVERLKTNDPIAPGPVVEDTTGRAASDLVREMRAKVTSAGFSDNEAKSFIKTHHARGYSVTVPVDKITFE